MDNLYLCTNGMIIGLNNIHSISKPRNKGESTIIKFAQGSSSAWEYLPYDDYINIKNILSHRQETSIV